MRGPVRAEQLGERRGGPAAVAARAAGRPGRRQRLGEDGRGLVGVRGAAVEVEVVDGVGAADPHDDVVRVVGPEPRPRGAATATTAARPASAWRHSDSTTGRTSRPGLPRPGRPDGEQGGPEHVGVEARARCRGAGTGCADRRRRSRDGPGGRAGRARPCARAGPGRPDGWPCEAAPWRSTVSVNVASVCRPARTRLPGALDPRVVDVVHRPAPRLGRQPISRAVRPGGPQMRPLGGIVLGTLGAAAASGSSRRAGRGG